MRIVIDMQGAQTDSRFRGIGRYTLSLTQAIVRNRGEHQIILALSGLFPDTIEHIRAAFDGLLPQENIRVWHAPGPVRECDRGNIWRHKVAERIREAFLASQRPDVVHISSLFEGFGDEAVTTINVFAPIPTVVTLYDLIPLLNPETYLKPNPAYAQYYQRKIDHLRRANQWLAISESAAGEGRGVLGLPADAVVNISTACDAVFRRIEVADHEKQHLLTQFGITLPFILYSGGADARKNLQRLIRAYARLPKILRNAQQLVLAGKMPNSTVAELRQTAKSAGICEGQLLFIGYVADEELAWLYNWCTVFVLPSCHEGFGLPALEAMACGAAVIGANTTSVPEVIGRQDALFDPYDEASISQKLAQVLSDAAFRAKLSAHGLEQARKFSWDESARRAIVAFERLHSDAVSHQKAVQPETILPDLVNAIAAIVPVSTPNVDLLKLAHTLSRIHIDDAPKQLFVDVSELVVHDFRSGVERVTYSILNELLENPPEGYSVEPVCCRTDAPGYCYARRFSARLSGVECDLNDEPIDHGPGDIFLGLDFQHYVALTQNDYLSSLHRDGVSVFFVVYDLVPGLVSHDGCTSHANIVHKTWLETLMGFDGAMCVSQEVADELASWQRVLGPKRLQPFKVCWFNSVTNIDNVFPNFVLPNDAKHVIQELARRPISLTADAVESHRHPTNSHSFFTEKNSSATFMPFSTCSANDFLHPRYLEICGLMKHPFVWHRKLWEFVFVIHQLLESGVVKPGSKGLVFGVGTERLPALFASMGAKIMATDAPVDLGRKKGWLDSSQHSSSLMQIRYPEIVDGAVFDANVSYQPCDMTNIQPELAGFDFNWSSCCLEHLGSLEAGILFVINAVEKTLRVGGIAVHTTEFNLSSNDDTVTVGDTVIYRHRDIEELVQRLRDRGHIVKPFITAKDSHYLDFHVDVPPYKDTLHLKLKLMGYVATSVGIVVQRGR